MKRALAILSIAALAALLQAAQPPKGWRYVYTVLEYPADYTNYFWQVQRSLDGKRWTALPGYESCHGQISGVIALTNEGPKLAKFRVVRL